MLIMGIMLMNHIKINKPVHLSSVFPKVNEHFFVADTWPGSTHFQVAEILGGTDCLGGESVLNTTMD